MREIEHINERVMNVDKRLETFYIATAKKEFELMELDESMKGQYVYRRVWEFSESYKKNRTEYRL